MIEFKPAWPTFRRSFQALREGTFFIGRGGPGLWRGILDKIVDQDRDLVRHTGIAITIRQHIGYDIRSPVT